MAGLVTVTIVQRTVTTVMGDSQVDDTEYDWPGCMVAPAGTVEDVNGERPLVVERIEIFGPEPPVLLAADDQLVVDGVTYNIEGRGADWASGFTTWEPGVAVKAVRGTPR